MDTTCTYIRETRDESMLLQCAEMMCASDPWKTLQRDSKACREALRGDYKEVYVIIRGDELLGFAVLQMVGAFKGYIQSICIAPDVRGQGLGSTLLKYCEERIFEECPNVFICVSSFNTDAARLYYRAGYQKAGELTDFLVPGHSEILLRKSIGPLIGFVPFKKRP
ncbi:MAG TPA: GNAT family N-acetyltransferase [Chitinophagaceae bacterium]|nr:GNAT family N-acetyltransferase [Chitinophagaceae bacterium]